MMSSPKMASWPYLKSSVILTTVGVHVGKLLSFALRSKCWCAPSGTQVLLQLFLCRSGMTACTWFWMDITGSPLGHNSRIHGWFPPWSSPLAPESRLSNSFMSPLGGPYVTPFTCCSRMGSRTLQCYHRGSYRHRMVHGDYPGCLGEHDARLDTRGRSR